MNVTKVLVVALACAGVALLGGCASMSKKGDSSAMNLNSSIGDDVDVAYIARINEEANKHFSAVVWVNPPQKQHGGAPHD